MRQVWKRALLAGMMLLAGSAQAEVSFRDKTINVLITTGAGGGTDSQARVVGRALQRYLPGAPNLVYLNMPGASGIVAANHFVHQTKPDGLTLLAASGETVEPTTLHNPSVRYDPHRFELVGGTTSGGTVMVMRKAALPRLADKAAPPVVIGSVTTRTGISMALWGGEYLGWNVKWVLGYPNTPALLTALERGEVDMTGSEGAAAQLKPLVESGMLVGLVQSGYSASGRFVARASFPEVPIFPDQMAGKLSGLARDAFDFWLYSNDVGKWFALMPGTPAEIVQAYRTAFQAVAQDAEFLQQSKKMLGEDFTLVEAADLRVAIDKLAATSEAALQFNRELRVKNGLPPD